MINTSMMIKRALLAFWIGFFVLQAEADQAVKIDKDQIGQFIHDYLLEHPEVIAEAQAKLERLLQEAQEKAQQAAIANMPANTYSPELGDPAGVMVTWFFDYRCGYCKRVEPAIQAVLKENNARVIFKELAILGNWSAMAAKAAIAANRQGQFKLMHEWLYANNDSDLNTTLAYAESIGMNKDQFVKDMNSAETSKELADVRDLAQQLNINGTPAFVIGSRLIPGAVELKVLQESIIEAKKPKA
jgi:protein-disulfide isomerase